MQLSSPRTSIPRTLRRLKPPPKPNQTRPTPTYTRNTIHKVSSLLRTLPWSTFLAHLNALAIPWDSHLVTKLLNTHPPLHKAYLFFLWAARLPSFRHDHFTYTSMLHLFGEAGRMESMTNLLAEMENRGVRLDAATYTCVMHWMARGGDVDGAVGVWVEMRRRRNVRPTVVSYTALMKILFRAGRKEEAAGVFREMLTRGLPPTCCTYTVLMDHLVGEGKVKAALDVMREMQESGVYPDKAACNILVQKLAKANETSAIVSILQYMKEQRLVLRRPIFLEALEAFKEAGASDHLLREANPHLALEGLGNGTSESETYGSDVNYCIDRDIIYNLLARKNFVAIEHILHGMISNNIKLDSEILSSIIQSNAMNARSDEALMALKFCRTLGKKPSRGACTSLIGTLMRMNSFSTVMEVVEDMIQFKIDFGPHLFSLLILKLGDAKMAPPARNFFSSLPNEQNTVTFTALIDVCFKAGDASTAVELFSDMRTRQIPVSPGTLRVMMAGLESVGRVQEAEACRKERKQLLFNYRPQLSLEETLCNRLFDSP